ncbi:MAG: hypothetical protein ACI93R_003622, partial [Flavobacteriales bacterium]
VFVMTEEQVYVADHHAFGGDTLTYTLTNVGAESSVICYSSEDTTDYGNENCTVSETDGVFTVSWTLSERVIDADSGDIADQEMRLAVGNNIQFLSTSTRVFVSSAPEVDPAL